LVPVVKTFSLLGGRPTIFPISSAFVAKLFVLQYAVQALSSTMLLCHASN